MKKILFLVAVIVASSCSKDEELVYSVPGYMTKVYTESTNCSQADFLTLHIDNETFNYDFSGAPGVDGIGHLMCLSKVGNTPSYSQNMEGHFTSFGFPGGKPNFVGLPVQEGISWTTNSGEVVPVEEVNLKELGVIVIVPKPFDDQFEIGGYRNITDETKYGFKIRFHFEVFAETAQGRIEGGYEVYLDPNKHGVIKITCVDKSIPGEIRLSGSFNGEFVGTEFFVLDGPILYRKQMSGEFSYRIYL
jgi:hypothetical protein